MVWGINFVTDVDLNRQQYSSIEEVEEAIGNLENDIIDATKILLMVATTNDLSKITEEDYDILYFVKDIVENAVTSIREAENNIVKLNLYIGYLQEKDEK